MVCSDQKGWGVVNEDFESDYQDLERVAGYSAIEESQLLSNPLVKKLMHLAWIQGKKQQQRKREPLKCPWCYSLNLTLKDQWYCNDCDAHWLNMQPCPK